MKRMIKIVFLSLFLVVFTLGVVGCGIKEKVSKPETKTLSGQAESVSEADVDKSISDVNSLDQEINTSDLDEIDASLEELDK